MLSNYFNQVLRHIKKVPTWYWLVGVAILFFVWMFLKPTPDTRETLVVANKDFITEVSVAGEVIAAQEVDLGFTQSGRITSVNARPGMRVGAGATLATIESGELRAAVAQRQAAVETQIARLAALKAGTRPEEIAVAEAAVESSIRSLVDDIKDAFREADSAVHNTMDQFISNPRTNPQLNFTVSDTSNLESRVEAGRFSAEGMLMLWGREVSALTTQSDVVTAAAHAQANLATVGALLGDANAAVNRAITNPQISQTTLDSYNVSLSAARSSISVSNSSISSGLSSLESARRTLTLKKAGTTPEDIAAQEAQIKAAQADVAVAQAQLSKTVISAPFSGIITTVDAKVGKIVSPNSPEISMIGSGTFQIDSYIPEVAISQLSVGQKAEVFLDAYGKNQAFEATVISIAPASELRDGVPTYKTMLQFSKADERIRAGMTADLSIKTQVKPNTIAIPSAALIRRGSSVFVKIAQGEETIEREVTTGLTSIGEIEILTGLTAGEKVVLNPNK